MSNQYVIDIIANALAENRLVDPGDPARHMPPRQVVLPIFQSEGQPKEVADLMSKTAIFLARAIVHLIETEGGMSMVPHAELEEMRVRTTPEAAGRRRVIVHCRCDRDRRDPLAVLTVDSSDRVFVDGKQFLGGLQDRAVDHPHGRA